MKRKSISLIIGLMAFALIGVMAMQYYFIRQSIHLKTQLFDESVRAALNTVALKAEKNEALRFLNAKENEEKRKRTEQEKKKNRPPAQSESDQYAQRMRMRSQKLKDKFKELEMQVKRRHPGAVLIDNDFYETYMKDPYLRSRVKYEVSIEHIMDERGRVFQQKDIGLYVDRKASVIKKAKDDSVRYFVVDPMVGELIITLPPRVDSELERKIRRYEQEAKARMAAQYVDSVKANARGNSAIETLANEFERSKRSLSQRIDPQYIVEQLREELLNRDIPLNFNLTINNGESDSVLFQLAKQAHPGGKENSYSAVLFPNDMTGNEGVMTIDFPQKSTLLLGNIKVMLISSAALLLVLFSCFTYTIMIILKQKKISEMKTDFINNMTHEFKTPVATIMIASESLKDPEIVQDKTRIERLAGIIYDENVRLGNHIERVLNIARIDKGELELESEPIDINELVSVVMDSMDLQFQKKGVQLSLDLRAKNPIVKGDELHFSNVLFNLIDNAIKYSKDKLNIDIETYNHGKFLHLIVRDSGIGMSKDELSKIFDQFYRIPTGNVHDVKGFGLGLSYVQDVIKKMGGVIKVKSELHKGTEFEIILSVNA